MSTGGAGQPHRGHRPATGVADGGRAGSRREVLAIVTSCMGFSAFSIDLLLPAFPEMRSSLGLADGAPEVSRTITAYLLGLAVGQLAYGPVSDRLGRKPVLLAGLAVMVVAITLSTRQGSLDAFVACRFLWGAGAAGARTLAVAMVRDLLEGDEMARTMSMVMASFFLISVVAPGIGSLILVVAPWRSILWLQLAAAAGLAVWIAVRLDETLPPAARRAVSPRALLEAIGSVLRARESIVYTVAGMTALGVMTSYLGSAELIVGDVYGRAHLFPVLFGLIATALVAGSLVGARLVVLVGTGRLVAGGVAYLVVVAAVFCLLAHSSGGSPPLPAVVGFLVLLLAGVTLLIPVCNSGALTPLGHVAGMASAFLGAVTTAGGALLGSISDAAFDGTIVPFSNHLLVYAAVGSCAVALRGRLRLRPS